MENGTIRDTKDIGEMMGYSRESHVNPELEERQR